MIPMTFEPRCSGTNLTLVLLGVSVAAACSSKGHEPTGESASANQSLPPASAPEVEATKPAGPGGLPDGPLPPEGAVVLEGTSLYVQTCGDPHPCPQLLQGEATKHCEGLTLGGISWRMPTLEEARRFASTELSAKQGFHWTATGYEDDAAQAWILDPVGGQSTTIPRDRKPFTARCVAQPTSGE